MNILTGGLLLICISQIGSTPADTSPATGPSPPSTAIDFTREVRPLLTQYCVACHGPDPESRQGGLRLDDRDNATEELGSGATAIVPGNPDGSEALRRMMSKDHTEQMPPAEFGKSLHEDELALIRRWIEQGADYAPHWAYIAPVERPLPSPVNSHWCTSPVDRFVAAKLDEVNWLPAAPADPVTLLRRVSLDLTGLPPTPEQLEAFLADDQAVAYERAVDRLLASPGYGERWATLWLDLGRYADSSGYIHDPPRTIWRWRDSIVQMLNDNVPYDQFTVRLLAGDLLTDGDTEAIIATGFNRNTMINTEGGVNSGEFQYVANVDRVNTTLQTWMGISIACAQCHDHKYDPFTQREFFQLFAIFNNTLDYNSDAPVLEVARIGHENEFARLAAEHEQSTRKLEELNIALAPQFEQWLRTVDAADLPEEVRAALNTSEDKRSAAETDLLLQTYRGLSTDWVVASEKVKHDRAALDAVSTTTLVMKEGEPKTTHLAIRGTYGSWGEAVEPAVPVTLHAYTGDSTVNRLQLANWIVSPENPLTARVAVNRLWQELFGVGIVATSEEFGTQGELPSHLELLDWLALEFIRSGWDTKHLLKLIVTSSTYRQSSHVTAEKFGLDPQNRLLSVGPRVRLSAEAIRDQALLVSGLLSHRMYGPPAHPHQPTNGLAAAFGPSTDWVASSNEDSHRRGLYTLWRRNLPYPSMLTFDVPERAVCTSRRMRTNTPIQALVTLNDPVFVEAAQSLARRILEVDVSSIGESAVLRQRAAVAITMVLARPAQEGEIDRIVALWSDCYQQLCQQPDEAVSLATIPLGPLPETFGAAEAAAWTVVANVLLNLDETLCKQ
jgi:mono/diheme cytochrome c family protein